MSLVEFRVPSSLESIWRFLPAICAEPHNVMGRSRTVLAAIDLLRERSCLLQSTITFVFVLSPPMSSPHPVLDRTTSTCSHHRTRNRSRRHSEPDDSN